MGFIAPLYIPFSYLKRNKDIQQSSASRWKQRYGSNMFQHADNSILDMFVPGNLTLDYNASLQLQCQSKRGDGRTQTFFWIKNNKNNSIAFINEHFQKNRLSRFHELHNTMFLVLTQTSWNFTYTAIFNARVLIHVRLTKCQVESKLIVEIQGGGLCSVDLLL